MVELVVINSAMVGINQSSITGVAWIDTFLDNFFFKRLKKGCEIYRLDLIMFNRFDDDLLLDSDKNYLINSSLIDVIGKDKLAKINYLVYDTGTIFSKNGVNRICEQLSNHFNLVH